MADRDPLEGLPPDLVRVLRDPSVIVPQDAAVFELVAKWMAAPSDTASAMSVDEWRRAWSVTCRRMLEAQHEAEALAARVDTLEAALRQVANVIGPEAPEHGCDGCTEEIGQALLLARAALADAEPKGGACV